VTRKPGGEALPRHRRPARSEAGLVDLRDLAVQRKDEGEFKSALEQLRARHSAKPSLLRQLEKAVTSDKRRVEN
jgi:hypothetical protein